MVVVGGLVGARGAGRDVVTGFSQGQSFGKGLAAGLAIVLLGVMLDRITQAGPGLDGARARYAVRLSTSRIPSTDDGNPGGTRMAG